MATSRSTGTTATGKTTQTEYATDTNAPGTPAETTTAPQPAKYVPGTPDPKPDTTIESAPPETATPEPTTATKTTTTVKSAGDGTNQPTASTTDDSKSADSVELNVPEGMDATGQYLREYITDMGPMQPQSPEDIQRHQMKLRGIINRVLAQDDEKFTQAMDMLVKAIRAHRTTTFHERYLFRGFAQLKISRGERQRFETIMSLLLTTADTKSKNSVKKTVDMNVVMKSISDNETQQKLQSYYNL